MSREKGPLLIDAIKLVLRAGVGIGKPAVQCPRVLAQKQFQRRSKWPSPRLKIPFVFVKIGSASS